MCSVKGSVEWLIGDHINYFKFMGFKKNLKLQLSAIGKMYIVSAIIRNALTCFHSNQTSEFFNSNPPTLDEYFLSVHLYFLIVSAE